MRVHAGVTTTAAAGTAMSTRWLGRLTRKRNKGGKINEAACAVMTAAAPAKIFLNLARWPHHQWRARRRGGERRRFPPRLEGRGIHMEEGKLELTLVSMGQSAGVGEAVQCELTSVEEDNNMV
jgi:hypothetical protein